MDINELRMKIDKIDSELVDLFQQRMDVAKDIAQAMMKMITGRKFWKTEPVPRMNSATRTLEPSS